MGRGFTIQKSYPVEGDSAVAELLYDGDHWAELELEDIALEARGDARVARARVTLRLLPRADHPGWPWNRGVKARTVDYEAAMAALAEAREWLLENERGRLPLYSS